MLSNTEKLLRVSILVIINFLIIRYFICHEKSSTNQIKLVLWIFTILITDIL